MAGTPVDVAICLEVNSSMIDLVYELSREMIFVMLELKKQVIY